jgi:hypothetical protein
VRRIVIAAITLIVSGFLLALVMTCMAPGAAVGHRGGIGTGMTALRWARSSRHAGSWPAGSRRRHVDRKLGNRQLVFLPLAAWLVEHVGLALCALPTIGR